MIGAMLMIILATNQFVAYASDFSTHVSSLKREEENVSRRCALSQSLYWGEDKQNKSDRLYQTNAFGDVFPLWQDIPEEKLKEK
ncbi:MAG: hypothetical protein ACH350_05175 [Parachlamydiaceae bacterium]